MVFENLMIRPPTLALSGDQDRQERYEIEFSVRTMRVSAL
jgi:hypothetical protein